MPVDACRPGPHWALEMEYWLVPITSGEPPFNNTVTVPSGWFTTLTFTSS